MLLLTVTAALGVGYFRLSRGMISLAPLRGMIESGINGELTGFSVKLNKVGLALADQGGFELRFSDASLHDADGAVVTTIPLGRIKLSTEAFLSARLAPESLDILNAKVIVAQASDGSFALGFAKSVADESAGKTDDAAQSTDAVGQPSVPGSDSVLPQVMRQLDVGRVLAEAAERTRRQQTSASYLKSVGLKQATLIVDHGGRKSLWRIADLDIDLAHQQKRSAISAVARLESQGGPWSISMHIADVEKAGTITLKLGLRDLVPRMLARTHPSLTLLEPLNFVVGAEATVELSRHGEVIGAEFDVVGGKGELLLPWLDGVPLSLDNARIRARYTRAERRIDILPSKLLWGRSSVTMSGSVTPAAAPDGNTIWAYDIRSSEGLLVDETLGTGLKPINKLTLSGSFRPAPALLQLEAGTVVVDGGQVTMDGRVGAEGDGLAGELSGRIGGMSIDTFAAIWPRSLAPKSRDWVGQHVTSGRVDSGSFRVARNAEDGGSYRSMLSLEASGVVANVIAALPPIELPRVIVRAETDTVEISSAEGSVKAKSGRRVALKGGRYTVAGLRSQNPVAELTGRAAAPLPAALELLDGAGLGLQTTVGLSMDALDGKVDGQFKLNFPASETIGLGDIKLEGKARITEGRAKAALAGYDVSSGTINLDLNEKGFEGKGDLLVRGSPMKLAWQRVFGLDQAKQPPVRLTAVLDATDRKQLGIDINHMLTGDVPVEITATRGAKGEPEFHVRAMLTGAELNLESIAWRKVAGQQAALDFDVVRGAAKRTELQNFRLVGDNIAIEGTVGLGSDNKLRDFHFPSFAINLISRLDVRGTLRQDNVWDIKARGSTFDGRDYFKGLFATRSEPAKPAGPPPERGGVALTAEIDTLLGFFDTSAKGLKLNLQMDSVQLKTFDAQAVVGGRTLALRLRKEPGKPRALLVESADAGSAFKMIGFYPNMLGGHANLEIGLDGPATATSGTLWVRNFSILGDPVVTEVLQGADDGRPAIGTGTGQKQRVVREQVDFDRMRVPFSISQGQLQLEHSYVQGALVGATLKGRVDFRTQRMALSGTYVPLHGLNSALGQIPLLGQILTGTRGEGLVGINFAIQGSMSQPEVIVHPLSAVAPGIFREMFQIGQQGTEAMPRPVPKAVRAPPTDAARSSSTAPSPKPAPGAGEPRVGGAWSTEATDSKGQKR